LKYNQPSDIPREVVEDIKTKDTYIRIARMRANKLGIELDELPDSEWREIWWKRAQRRSRYYQSTKLEQVAEQHEKVVEELLPPTELHSTELQEYLQYYTDPAPNDIITLQQLISFQGQLSKVDALISETLDPPDGEDVNTTRYKNLVGIQKNLSTEIRLLQDNLGISRRIRDQQRTESELADHYTANIKQARELLDEIGTKLICPHCRAENGSLILQGFVIDHFPETGLYIKKRCPTCSRVYEIEVPPRKWERRLVK